MLDPETETPEESLDGALPFFPDFIGRHLSGAQSVGDIRFCSSVYVELTGFLDVQETRCQNRRAAEETFSTLNDFVSSLLEIVGRHGGDVIQLSGPVLHCIWPVSAAQFMPQATRQAIHCAAIISAQEVTFDVPTFARVGVGAGPCDVIISEVRDVTKYLVVGSAVQQSVDMVACAISGEVFVSSEAQLHFEKTKAEGYNLVPLDVGFRLESCLESSIPSLPSPLPPKESVEKQFDADKVRPWFRDVLRVAPSAFEGQLRVVSTIAIRLSARDINHERILNALLGETSKFGGILNHVGYGPHGMGAHIFFGLPYTSQEGDNTRALELLMSLLPAVEAVGGSFNVGISRAHVFCGVVGDAHWKGYAVIGEGVSIADVLLSQGREEFRLKPRVICDEKTTQGLKPGSFQLCKPTTIAYRQRSLLTFEVEPSPGNRNTSSSISSSNNSPIFKSNATPQSTFPPSIVVPETPSYDLDLENGHAAVLELVESPSRQRHVRGKVSQVSKRPHSDSLRGTTTSSARNDEKWSTVRNAVRGGWSTPLSARSTISSICIRSEFPTTTSLIGRAAEVKAVEQLVHRLRSFVSRHPSTWMASKDKICSKGYSRVLIFSGDVGMGKTALMEKVRTICSTEGLSYLRACGAIQNTYTPFSGLQSIVYEMLDRMGGNVQAEHPKLQVKTALARFGEQLSPEARAHLPLLSLVDPVLKKNLPALDSSMEPAEQEKGIYKLLQDMLEVVFQKQPLCLLLDDAQWLDMSTMGFVSQLLACWSMAGVVCAYREVKNVVAAAVCQEAEGEDGSTNVPLVMAKVGYIKHRLRHFGLSEMRQMLCELLGATVDDALLNLIYDQSDGNPGFATQILRGWTEHKVLEVSQDTACLVKNRQMPLLSVTLTLGDALIARIDTLRPKYTQLLKTASVIGRTFQLDTLEFLLGQSRVEDERVIATQLNHLCTKGFLYVPTTGGKSTQGSQSYCFAISAMKSVVYSMLLINERRRLHSLMAKWLTAEGGSQASVIAQHHQLADNIPKALSVLQESMAEAFLLQAYRKFVHLMHTGLALEQQQLSQTARLSDSIPVSAVAAPGGRGGRAGNDFRELFPAMSVARLVQIAVSQYNLGDDEACSLHLSFALKPNRRNQQRAPAPGVWGVFTSACQFASQGLSLKRLEPTQRVLEAAHILVMSCNSAYLSSTPAALLSYALRLSTLARQIALKWDKFSFSIQGAGWLLISCASALPPVLISARLKAVKNFEPLSTQDRLFQACFLGWYYLMHRDLLWLEGSLPLAVSQAGQLTGRASLQLLLLSIWDHILSHRLEQALEQAKLVQDGDYSNNPTLRTLLLFICLYYELDTSSPLHEKLKQLVNDFSPAKTTVDAKMSAALLYLVHARKLFKRGLRPSSQAALDMASTFEDDFLPSLQGAITCNLLLELLIMLVMGIELPRKQVCVFRNGSRLNWATCCGCGLDVAATTAIQSRSSYAYQVFPLTDQIARLAQYLKRCSQRFPVTRPFYVIWSVEASLAFSSLGISSPISLAKVEKKLTVGLLECQALGMPFYEAHMKMLLHRCRSATFQTQE